MTRILFLALLLAFSTAPVLAGSHGGASDAAMEAKDKAADAAEGEKQEGDKKKKKEGEEDCE